MKGQNRTVFQRLVTWVVVRRVPVLMTGCLLISILHTIHFAVIGIWPLIITGAAIIMMYLVLVFNRHIPDEMKLTMSCLSIDVYAMIAIAFLGNGTAFEFYIYGVIASIFPLLPGSGNKRYLYQVVSFMMLAAAHGLANRPHIELARACQAAFTPYLYETWYVNFIVSFIVAVGVSFFFAQSTEKSLEELEDIALSDELTGLANRHHAVPRLRNEEDEFSLAILDIDDFKAVNDNYGHEAGDEVLKAIASCMRGCVRAGDEVARWGGEEFLIMLPGCPLRTGERVLELVRSSIENLEFTSLPNVHVTISAGLTDRRGRTWEQVLLEADHLLYYSKGHGKNQVSSYTNVPLLA